MTGRPTDDELRAMLDARADRLTAAAEHEVLQAVRAEVRGPAARPGREGLAFAVRPVSARRGPSAVPWRMVVIGLAAVVAVAVLGSRLDLGRDGPVVSGSPSASASAASPSPAAGSPAPGGSPLPVVAPEDLAARLALVESGERALVVTGRLRVVQARCRGAGAPEPDECWWFELAGAEEVVIRPGSLAVDEAVAAVAAHPEAAPLALRTAGGGAELLGWLVDGTVQTLTPTMVWSRTVPLASEEVAIVDGWLQDGAGAAACGVGTVDCPSPWSRLTDELPVRDGSLVDGLAGMDVALDDAVRVAAPGIVRGGRFVVGRNATLGGEAPEHRVLVAVDGRLTFVEVGLAAGPAGTIRVEDLPAALAGGGLGGRLLLLEGTATPLGDCGDGADACLRFAVEGLSDVRVTTDADWLRTISRIEGTLVLTPRDDGLELLGRLGPGGTDAVSPDEGLAGHEDDPDPAELTAVDGWLTGAGLSRPCPMWTGGVSLHTCQAFGNLLATKGEAPDADGPVRVGVPLDAPGTAGFTWALDPSIGIAGPFLVRSPIPFDCSVDEAEGDCMVVASTWTVAARYAEEDLLRVVLP